MVCNCQFETSEGRGNKKLKIALMIFSYLSILAIALLITIVGSKIEIVEWAKQIIVLVFEVVLLLLGDKIVDSIHSVLKK